MLHVLKCKLEQKNSLAQPLVFSQKMQPPLLSKVIGHTLSKGEKNLSTYNIVQKNL